MPMLPKRGCIEPGCGAAALDGGRCLAHKAAAQHAKQRSYDDQRGTTIERGYDADHRRLRLLCFQRDDWRCRGCGWEPDVVRDCRLADVDAPPAHVVLEELRRAKLAGERHLHMDHILPIATHPDLRLELDNAQTLCDWCHRRKTMKEKGLAFLDPRQDRWPVN
jgi:5-methylcytosine-specific restriction endonuclease McrA